MPPTVSRLLSDARERLSKAPFRPSTREALLLLSRVVELAETDLLAHPEARVPERQARRFEQLLSRRLQGEPVAYLLGEKEFFGRTFRVDERVLIPRPETEHLIEEALRLELPARPLILDLGAGSGCLAATLAAELPAATVVAADRSPGALAVAARNLARVGVADRALAVATDFGSGLALERFDLVVCNPPYIEPDETVELSPEILDYEPTAALVAAEGFEDLLQRLFKTLAPLPPGRPLLLEIGRGQLPLVRRAAAAGGFAVLRVTADYSSIPRVVSLLRR